MSKIRKDAEKKVDKYLKTKKYEKLKIEVQSIELKAEPQKDVVPVQLNAKTTIMVPRHKCMLVDGKWVKK